MRVVVPVMAAGVFGGAMPDAYAQGEQKQAVATEDALIQEAVGGAAKKGTDPVAAGAAPIAVEGLGLEAEAGGKGASESGAALPEGASAIIDDELISRKAHQEHAEVSAVLAEKAMRDGKFQEAVRLFEEALRSIQRAGERAGNEVTRKKITDGLAESHYLWSSLLIKERDFARAEQQARNAGSYWHPKAAELLAKIEKEKIKPAPPVAVYPPSRWNQEEYKKQQSVINDHFRFGKQFYLTGEYKKAELHFESILKLDPENTEAMRMMSKIAQKKTAASSAELATTREGMVADVRKSWNRRDYALSADKNDMPTATAQPTRMKDLESQRISVQEKMEEIIIPEIEFRQSTIFNVIDFINQASREFDRKEKDETKKGVNVILNLTAGRATKPAAIAEPAANPFAEAPAGVPAAGSEIPLVTFNARNISLYEALRIVTEVAKLKFRIEGSVVMVVPIDTPDGRIITQFYTVLPTLVTRLPAAITSGFREGGDGGAALGIAAPAAGESRVDFRELFESMGVKWPAGSSIRYIEQIGKLVVANTAENLHAFEKILAFLNVVPSQIEIEARFVEVRQADLSALGLEWLMTDDWEVAQKKGMEGLPADQRQRISVAANDTGTARGFTKGNRFLTSGVGLPSTIGVADELLKVSSFLTNPELTMILHAMEQKGNADLLSAPKVTTQNGIEATIKVVTEYIYPTEFDVTPITGTGAGNVATIVGGVVAPAAFETRDVGVILTVTPEVTPDGQMINLAMTPQVVDEPEWHEYGSVYTDSAGNRQTLSMQQPFFKTRQVSTSLMVYNGATVVMGGMINEHRNAVDDKIPFLGDIPLLGRLFRSKYEHSDKRNLLIFVTARLVDPSGRAVQPQRDELPPNMGGSTASSEQPAAK
jgi:general secretion pathway protein D